MRTDSLCFCVAFSGKPPAKHSDLVQQRSRCSHKLLAGRLPSPLCPKVRAGSITFESLVLGRVFGKGSWVNE